MYYISNRWRFDATLGIEGAVAYIYEYLSGLSYTLEKVAMNMTRGQSLGLANHMEQHLKFYAGESRDKFSKWGIGFFFKLVIQIHV